MRGKDIQLLFADASTGANSPALVRQGQISELIGSKPQNRRRILEEAECGPSVKRLKNLFGGHPTWQEFIRESGSSAWLASTVVSWARRARRVAAVGNLPTAPRGPRQWLQRAVRSALM